MINKTGIYLIGLLRIFRSLAFGHAILLVLLMVCWVQPMHSQQEHEIGGRVVRLEDSVPVPGAHVINLTGKMGTITSSEGRFTINAMSGDSILFSAIGFKTDTIVAAGKETSATGIFYVYLEEQLYDIDAVDIYPLPPTYAGFKREFIYGFDSIPQYYSIIRDLSVMPARTDPPPPGVVGSPVSWLYNRYSREGRELRKYGEVLAQERMRGRWTLNYELVKMVTGLEEDEDILEFFAFCGFTVQWLNISTELDVTEAISDCFNKYNEQKED
jgi:hypothetical protein